MRKLLLMMAIFATPVWSVCSAKVDLVTLPKRDTVQLTIYNSADLTLVREQRELTLQKGINRLQFSWANTLIDPTSLEMLPKAESDTLNIRTLKYPPRAQNVGVWEIESQISGKVPVEISYLTSGLGWRAFYQGTLSGDEKTLHLEGYVRIDNQSGEDYADAQTRLLVGEIHLLDDIAVLARRSYPYDRPGFMPKDEKYGRADGAAEAKDALVMVEASAMAGGMEVQKIIEKEGISEYFLYTIEGRETIPTGWAKRLPSFTADDVPVINLYKFEEEEYGTNVVRFLSFKNDKEHKLGVTPIPGGLLRVFRNADQAGHLSYEGQSEFKYIPVDEKVELNLGAVQNVVVRPTLMSQSSEKYEFDQWGNISAWDEVREFKVDIKNTRTLPVRVEVRRNFPDLKWDMAPKGDCGEYTVEDKDTVKFTIVLEPRSQKTFHYTLRTHHGSRAP